MARVLQLLLIALIVQAAGASSNLGWMDDIEDSDRARAHAVGELGRMDTSYEKVERVRAQAKSIQDAAAKSEDVLEKRIALLLAKGTKKGLDDKVLLSGLSTHLPVQKAQPSAGPATIPITATGPKRASALAQRVQHGSNALFNLLSGHIGVPNTTPHHNTLFFHASTNPLVAAVTHTQAIAAAAASGGARREQAQKVVKQQAESWFWPFDAARANPAVKHTLAAVPLLLPSAARARKEAVVRGRAALVAASGDRSEEKAKPDGVKTRAQGLEGARGWSMPEFALGNMRFGM